MRLSKTWNHWQPWEIEVLKQYFGKLGVREIKRKFLPKRSRGAIHRMAERLGLNVMTQEEHWKRCFVEKELPQTVWAYLAGIVDGEGTLTILVDTWKKRGEKIVLLPLVAISNKDESLMNWLQKTFQMQWITRNGVSGFGAKRGLQTSITTYPFVRWILKNISHYLIIKKKHADLILKFIECRGQRRYNSPYTWDDFNLLLEVRKLNVGHGKRFELVERSLRQKFENYLEIKT